jgi:hypothetical protein
VTLGNLGLQKLPVKSGRVACLSQYFPRPHLGPWKRSRAKENCGDQRYVRYILNVMKSWHNQQPDQATAVFVLPLKGCAVPPDSWMLGSVSRSRDKKSQNRDRLRDSALMASGVRDPFCEKLHLVTSFPRGKSICVSSAALGPSPEIHFLIGARRLVRKRRRSCQIIREYVIVFPLPSVSNHPPDGRSYELEWHRDACIRQLDWRLLEEKWLLFAECESPKVR